MATGLKATASLESFRKHLDESTICLLEAEVPRKIAEVSDIIESISFETEKSIFQLKTFNEFQISSLKVSLAKLPKAVSNKVASSSEDSSSAGDPRQIRQQLNIQNLDSNPFLRDLIGLVKPVMLEALNNVRTVILWIQLKVPEIADGNNFGVSVQEDVMDNLKTIESQLLNDLDVFTDYYNQRGKLFTKLIKFHKIDDFGQGIVEHDEAFFSKLKETLKKLKTHYLVMQDLCMKNLAKITLPRNEKNIISSMY